MLDDLLPAPVPAIVNDPVRLEALDAYAILDTPPEEGFDDIVLLATQMCEAPVALVSLVAGDRQWFKAKMGFPRCETDLDSSVCAHALSEPDLLIVPDLSLDPRTRGNPLVVGEPRIRFYAGAPLRGSGDQVLGSLCVIDQIPRPGGLTPRQAEALRALGRQVVSQLELRRSSIENARSAAARDAVLETQRSVNTARGDLDAILAAIVSGAMRAVPHAEGGVVELRDGDELVYRIAGGALAAHVGLRLPLRGSIAGACLLSGGPVLCADARTDPRVKQDFVDLLNLGSCVLAPVVRGGDTVGVLKLQSSRLSAFRDDDLKLVSMLAASASTALADADVRSQGELLQTVTNHVGQAVFRLDDRGAVTFANPAAEMLLGWTAAEMIGQSLHPLVHHSYPDGRPYPAEECPIQQALWNGRPLPEGEHTFFHRDGTSRQVLVTNAPLHSDGSVVGAVLTVGDITARKRAETRLADSEAYWRGMFERLQEGLVVGQVVKDESDGRITDWRYLDVNPAWSRLLGIDATHAIGRTIREVLPGIEDEWVDEPAYVVETGEPLSFTRQVGQLGRWYEGRVSPLGPETFLVLFLDVTERVRAEEALALSGRRKAALLHLGDCLRTTSDVQAMGYTAASILGQALGACRAGYSSIVSPEAKVIVESDWRLPGVQSVVGTHRFGDYGSFIDDLKAGRSVFISDIRADLRTRDAAEAFEALATGAIYHVPILEHGEFVSMFFVHFSAPHVLGREGEDLIRAFADRTRAAIARVRADERQSVINLEISHRLKNTLAIVQAIANQTLKGASDREAVASFDQRLMALSTAHDVLLQKDWDKADFAEVLRRVLDSAGAAGRYEVDGPAMVLGPRAALSTSLLLHELTTNAAKYGALSQPAGKVCLRWWLEGKGDAEEFALEWRETGGPSAHEPARQGFGSRLLRMGLVGAGGSNLEYSQAGLTAVFRASRTHVERT